MVPATGSLTAFQVKTTVLDTKQAMYRINVTLMHVRATTIAVEKQ
jgi:hypothetical protein